MRFIGSISDAAAAARFGDFLTSIGIASTVEPGTSGFSVWVHDDDQLDRARSELSSFNANPHDARYAGAEKVARQRAVEQDRKQRTLERNFIDYRTRFAAFTSKPAPVTIALIVICCFVAAATRLGEGSSAASDWLLFGRLSDAQVRALSVDQNVRDLREMLGLRRRQSTDQLKLRMPGSEDILHGQLWRLFTPMFLHFGIIHLVFNMFWLIDLGGVVERRLGSWAMLGLVLACSLICNLAQFYWAGPVFGGMSGVVYGLFGYIWIKSIVQPGMGFQMPRDTVMWMLGWLVLCMTGMLGPVANAGHVGGLLAGVVLAHAPYSWKQMKRSLAARRGG